MDKFSNEVVPYIIGSKHTKYYDKHTSLPQNPYIVKKEKIWQKNLKMTFETKNVIPPPPALTKKAIINL